MSVYNPIIETIKQKDAAIDAAIRALDRLSKKGSITRELREETMATLWAARQTPLEGIDGRDTAGPTEGD